MELRRLRYFVTVAEEMHFGRAAERLNMAQQPLSAQIRLLEREVGHDLFERYANRIRFTPAGQVFAGEARVILERSEHAVQLARRAAAGEVGVVRVGFCTAARERVLPDVIRALKKEQPSIGIDLRELNQADQLLALQRDELDVGFVYRPFDERTFASFDLFEDPLVVAVPIDHPLAHEKQVLPQQLAGESLVVLSDDRHSLLAGLTDQISSDRSDRAAPFVVNDAGTALALVARGLGVGVLSMNSAGSRRDTVLVPLETPERLRFVAVWSKLAPKRIIRERFVRCLQDVEAGLIP